MLAFFKPLRDEAEVAAQAQRLLAQTSVLVEKEAAERQRATLLKPGRGRPRKKLDPLMLMAAAEQPHAEGEPPLKRGKYKNW